jgi:hypothetical protein
MLFLSAVAAFSKFSAKRTRHTIPVLRNRADDAARHRYSNAFPVDQTGAVTDDMVLYVRMARNAKTTENGMGSLCCVRPDCSRRATGLNE